MLFGGIMFLQIGHNSGGADVPPADVPPSEARATGGGSDVPTSEETVLKVSGMLQEATQGRPNCKLADQLLCSAKMVAGMSH